MQDATASLTAVRIAGLLGLDGFTVLAAVEVGGELELLIETTAELVACPRCGAVARPKDRRPNWVRDLPIADRPVVLCWWKRVWCCPHPLCEQKTWTERHPAIRSRAALTERARQWAFEQVGDHDAAVSTVAAQLGVAWWTVMDQVIDRGVPLIEDSVQVAPTDGAGSTPVTAVGVDETAFLRANATHSTTFATGIADLTPGRPARLLDVIEGRSGTMLADWLAGQPAAWRAAVSTASLDPFRGYATVCVPRTEQYSRPVDEDLLGGFGLRCLVGPFDEFAALERRPGADEGDQVRAVDRAPTILRGLDQLERHRQPGRP
jgi:transposase